MMKKQRLEDYQLDVNTSQDEDSYVRLNHSEKDAILLTQCRTRLQFLSKRLRNFSTELGAIVQEYDTYVSANYGSVWTSFESYSDSEYPVSYLRRHLVTSKVSCDEFSAEINNTLETIRNAARNGVDCLQLHMNVHAIFSDRVNSLLSSVETYLDNMGSVKHIVDDLMEKASIQKKSKKQQNFENVAAKKSLYCFSNDRKVDVDAGHAAIVSATITKGRAMKTSQLFED